MTSELTRAQNGILYRTVNAADDALRWLHIDKIAWWPFYVFAVSRQRLTEGKTRRLLRRAVRSWVTNGVYSQHYFRAHELKTDLGDQIIVVTIQKRPEFR